MTLSESKPNFDPAKIAEDTRDSINKNYPTNFSVEKSREIVDRLSSKASVIDHIDSLAFGELRQKAIEMRQVSERTASVEIVMHPDVPLRTRIITKILRR